MKEIVLTVLSSLHMEYLVNSVTVFPLTNTNLHVQYTSDDMFFERLTSSSQKSEEDDDLHGFSVCLHWALE